MVEFYKKEGDKLIKVDANAPKEKETLHRPRKKSAPPKRRKPEQTSQKRERPPRRLKKEEAPKTPEAKAEPAKQPERSETDRPKENRKRRPRKPRPTAAEQKPAEKVDEANVDIDRESDFAKLGIPDEVLKALTLLKFKKCTPIQEQVLPHALKGKDVSGQAQTGTGKTAAFLLTLFTRLETDAAPFDGKHIRPKALIMAPTRELAQQILKEAEEIGKFSKLRAAAVFGGEPLEKQSRKLLSAPCDILIATPGRLLDYHQRRVVYLNHVETLVIDEADRMLDMGFIPDLRTIIHSLPSKTKRQTMLLSATLPPEVIRLSSNWTTDPVKLEVAPENITAETVEQLVYIVTAQEKFKLLYNLLTKDDPTRTIVFVNRRDQAQRLSDELQARDLNCALMSGALRQERREKMLEQFKSGALQILVATDLAGRGLHIDGVSHVINYSLPHDAENYVHRIGRTGRAGTEGTSISFACEEDSFYIPDIEAYTGQPLKCTHPEEALLTDPPRGRPIPKKPSQVPRGRSSGSRPPRRNRPR